MSQRTAATSLVVGVLAIPALVLGVSAVFDGDAAAADDTTATVLELPVDDPASIETVVDDTVATEVTSAPADVAAACGPDGMSLVEREAEGSITPLEQAALDALRPICVEAGIALPDAPAPEPVVVVETVSAGAAALGTSGDDSPSGDSDDDWDDDDSDDDDWDDDDWDDDDYDDDDHDDDDHDDDDDDDDDDDHDDDDDDDHDDEDDD